jgi:SOS-response transcriptional repressor LexA
MTSPSGAFSWNSELPSGRSPFWIRDDALADLGLHAGDAVSVDTRAEPHDGELVVVEVDLDGDSCRMARRFFKVGDRVRLEAEDGGASEALDLSEESVMVMGVIAARLWLPTDGGQPIEAPLHSPDSATVEQHEHR